MFFFSTIDIIQPQLITRFAGFNKVSDIFLFLQPKNLINSTESEILKSCDYIQ